MKKIKLSTAPIDSSKRKKERPVICYPINNINNLNLSVYQKARKDLKIKNEIIIPPRDAKCFKIDAGQFFRIENIEGPQVGDLNLFNADNLEEKFYSGKTRALHGTHLSTGDQMWSCFPYLRPLATITWDTLDWYGFDDDGSSVHDIIGTRCDPYTAKLLGGNDYHYCCHSNLIRALVKEKGLKINEAEKFIHDVLNVFMCTGFTKNTHQYFMKATPARPGDYIEFFAETNLLGVLSSCPGGDCGSEHSSDKAKCYPLKVTTYSTSLENLKGWSPPLTSSYNKKHGM
mgnify:CR=1 FL=1